MKVIVDDKIPFINEAIERIADRVIYTPGSEFTPELVKDADALIIRTRTHCNRELLEGSAVQFIATATIGYDHIDTEYCRRAGIAWTNAPGCNAASVGQYVESSLLLLQKKSPSFCLEGSRIGVVGTGNVGSRIVEMAKKHGMTVLKNDPPLQDRYPETASAYSSLEEMAETCNFITFHTPLNREGRYKTFHLADEPFFSMLNPRNRTVLINSSRGEVVDTKALLRAMDSGKIKEAIIDVWEGEPHVNKELLERAFIATPHIAGYSTDGKANATRMSLEALCRHFHIQAEFTITPPPPVNPVVQADSEDEALIRIYNPLLDSLQLKREPERFEWFRGNYPIRRERGAYKVQYGG